MSECKSNTECSPEGKYNSFKGEECDMPEKMLCLADEAWMEVVKEKIKKEIEASCGEKISELAKIVASANMEKWQMIMTGKQKCAEYKENLKRLFTSH